MIHKTYHRASVSCDSVNFSAVNVWPSQLQLILLNQEVCWGLLYFQRVCQTQVNQSRCLDQDTIRPITN